MSVEFLEAPIDNERVSPHKHRIADYLQPKTLTMLLLGFSSGLALFSGWQYVRLLAAR